jgi:hypothetical protein
MSKILDKEFLQKLTKIYSQKLSEFKKNPFLQTKQVLALSEAKQLEILFYMQDLKLILFIPVLVVSILKTNPVLH